MTLSPSASRPPCPKSTPLPSQVFCRGCRPGADGVLISRGSRKNFSPCPNSTPLPSEVNKVQKLYLLGLQVHGSRGIVVKTVVFAVPA